MKRILAENCGYTVLMRDGKLEIEKDGELYATEEGDLYKFHECIGIMFGASVELALAAGARPEADGGQE